MLNPDVTSCIYLAHAPKDHKHLNPLLEKLWTAGFSIINLDGDNTVPETATSETASPAPLIAAADQLIFALSPRSANSTVCQRELKIALRLHKRIIPAVISELRGAPVPIPLSRLNYIFFTPPASYDLSFETLKKILLQDRTQLEEHAHFSTITLSWEQNNYTQQQLLSGQALERAEQWLAAAQDRTPAPTRLQREFIAASRQQENQNKKRHFIIVCGLLMLVLISGAYGAVLLLL